MKRRLVTLATGPYLRGLSAADVGQVAQAYEASEVVDQILIADQLLHWVPRSIWRPDVLPIAAVLKDPDCWADPVVNAAFVTAATRTLGVALTGDAIRRGPAETMLAMLTLAGSAERDISLWLGAGELKQIKPFGYKRSEGLARLEDLLRLFRLLWDHEEPFDFDGNIWKLRNAYVGSQRPPRRPKFYAMGGGPRLIDIAAKYADGIGTYVPGAFPTPEAFGEMVTNVRRQLEQNGRDPDTFDFALMAPTLMSDDAELIEAAVDNLYIRFTAALFGRLHMDDWEREGMQGMFPKGFHYALHYIPTEMTEAEAQHITDGVSRAMVDKSYLAGTVKEVAGMLSEFVEAGATHVLAANVLDSIGPVDNALNKTVEGTIELYGALKSGVVYAGTE